MTKIYSRCYFVPAHNFSQKTQHSSPKMPIFSSEISKPTFISTEISFYWTSRILSILEDQFGAHVPRKKLSIFIHYPLSNSPFQGEGNVLVEITWHIGPHLDGLLDYLGESKNKRIKEESMNLFFQLVYSFLTVWSVQASQFRIYGISFFSVDIIQFLKTHQNNQEDSYGENHGQTGSFES